MNVARRLLRLEAFLAAMAVVLAGCRPPAAVPEATPAADQTLSGELILCQAGNLAVPLQAVSQRFLQKYPHVTIATDTADSHEATWKAFDSGWSCDVLASADSQIVESSLMPDHAEFNIHFATNEMAVAYAAWSKYAAEISPQNWPKVLLRPEVAFGRADPLSNPSGYRTVMLLQLAEQFYPTPELAEQFLAKDARYVRADEADLLGLLKSGEIDYLFMYRSVIEQQHLKIVLLPDEINLGSPRLADHYRTAAVNTAGSLPGQWVEKRGQPIACSVTIPRHAPHPRLAEAYLSLLLSPEGHAILKANGQHPLAPAIADPLEKVPASLRPFCRQKASFDAS